MDLCWNHLFGDYLAFWLVTPWGQVNTSLSKLTPRASQPCTHHCLSLCSWPHSIDTELSPPAPPSSFQTWHQCTATIHTHPHITLYYSFTACKIIHIVSTGLNFMLMFIFDVWFFFLALVFIVLLIHHVHIQQQSRATSSNVNKLHED